MKILFKILIGIVGFIALLLVIALFVSRDYRVEREIAIGLWVMSYGLCFFTGNVTPEYIEKNGGHRGKANNY